MVLKIQSSLWEIPVQNSSYSVPALLPETHPPLVCIPFSDRAAQLLPFLSPTDSICITLSTKSECEMEDIVWPATEPRTLLNPPLTDDVWLSLCWLCAQLY